MTEIADVAVLYEDEYFIVVDKPVGLPVHKNEHMPRDANYLTKTVGQQKGKSIYNVHRLDAKTSGVIILACTSEAAGILTRQFEQKQVSKKYLAITKGNPGEGTFNDEVMVKKKTKIKKPARTSFTTIFTIDTNLVSKNEEQVDLSLVEIQPQTGRWHQIRQHFARNRFDIIGDTHHGDFTLNKIITGETGIKRLMLHALELVFWHPYEERQVTVRSEKPGDFARLLEQLKKE